MNENKKSAIEQMVEWLKKRRAKVFVWNDNYVERQSVLRKAQELQAEEQAQKPTAPAGLWEELNDLYKKSLYHPGLCLNVMGAYDVKDLLDKYRPAPSSDEGSFKILEPNSVEQAIELYRNNPIFNRLVDLRVQEILSRHPATAKSADHFVEVNKMVKRLREHISDQKLKEADYLVYDEIEAIINEFSKDADKEGR